MTNNSVKDSSCWNPDPVYEAMDGWYFYDEVWCNSFGPFPSRELAEKACCRYAEMYLEGKEDPYPEIAELIKNSNIQWK